MATEFQRVTSEPVWEGPLTTMVEVKALIDPAMLIEIEADAVLRGYVLQDRPRRRRRRRAAWREIGTPSPPGMRAV